MFDTVTAHSILMDRLHKDVSCRLNTCKYANSVRHAGVQVVSVNPVATPSIRQPLMSAGVQRTSLTAQQQASAAAQTVRPPHPQQLQQASPATGVALAQAPQPALPSGRGRPQGLGPRLNTPVPTSVS